MSPYFTHHKQDLKSMHTREAIRTRLQAGPEQTYLRDFIYGAIDGTVTTFAIVAGVAGAALSTGIVLILGLANLIGDGFSMAVSNFLGTRAMQQLREEAWKMEEEHIEKIPEGEKEEVRQIFAAKGFQGKDLERAVEIITADRQRWINMMLTEELGMPIETPSAWRAAAVTFLAFIAVGAIPLVPYLYKLAFPASTLPLFFSSSVITGAAFFIVGALKSRFVGQNWFAAGLETLIAGGGAAAIAYLIGALLKDLATRF